MELDYNIISTGSKGNAVRIGDIMVDCGVPFNKMKQDLYKCKVLLLTHIHGDHINKTTIRKIAEFFPRLTIIGNWEVFQRYSDYVDVVCNAGFPIETKAGIITPFELVHDVVTYGFHWKKDGKQILYATDTSSMDSIDKDFKVDYCFLESNYDSDKLNYLLEHGNWKEQYGYDVRNGCLRHFSAQQCKGFFYSHRKTNDAVLIPLHMSSRFM